MKVSFTVTGDPRGKGRPRFCRSGHTYTDSKTKDYEKHVKACYLSQVGAKKLTGCVSATLRAFVTAPKRTSVKTLERMEKGKIRPSKKPDADNIAKAICDGLNGIAYEDDAAIAVLIVEKYYSRTPRVEVELTELE